MIDREALGNAEATYLRQLESYLHELPSSDRAALVDEVADSLVAKQPASDLEVLVAELGTPQARAARLRADHGLAPPRRRAPATIAGTAMMVLAACAAVGLLLSWWLTYELELGVDAFAAGYGDILDPEGIAPVTGDERQQLLVAHHDDRTLDLLVEVTNLDSRSLTVTGIAAPDVDLIDLEAVRWRWVDPSLPADVADLDTVEIDPDGATRSVRLLLTFAFADCTAGIAGRTDTLSTIEVHYRALGRDRTNELELPVDLVIVADPDAGCPARP